MPSDSTAARPPTRDEILQRYPRLVAHVIAESLGYATPRTAAAIIQDAVAERPNCSEWIAHGFRGNARAAVNRAITSRHYHHGPMGSYFAARAVVARAQTGEHPVFASWF